MSTLFCRRLLPAALLSLATAASALASDAFDATAPVPPAVYESPFRAYRGHADADVRDWKTTNDTVGRIGGWRAYAREASAPASSTRPATPASGAASPGGDVPAAGAAGGADPRRSHGSHPHGAHRP